MTTFYLCTKQHTMVEIKVQDLVGIKALAGKKLLVISKSGNILEVACCLKQINRIVYFSINHNEVEMVLN